MARGDGKGEGGNSSLVAGVAVLGLLFGVAGVVVGGLALRPPRSEDSIRRLCLRADDTEILAEEAFAAAEEMHGHGHSQNHTEPERSGWLNGFFSYDSSTYDLQYYFIVHRVHNITALHIHGPLGASHSHSGGGHGHGHGNSTSPATFSAPHHIDVCGPPLSSTCMVHNGILRGTVNLADLENSSARDVRPLHGGHGIPGNTEDGIGRLAAYHPNTKTAMAEVFHNPSNFYLNVHTMQKHGGEVRGPFIGVC